MLCFDDYSRVVLPFTQATSTDPHPVLASAEFWGASTTNKTYPRIIVGRAERGGTGRGEDGGPGGCLPSICGAANKR